MAREHDLLTKKNTSRNYLKILDQVRGQGVGRRKSGAYTAVCEHFEPIYNDTIGPQTDF